jgi:hypothetical protein
MLTSVLLVLLSAILLAITPARAVLVGAVLVGVVLGGVVLRGAIPVGLVPLLLNGGGFGALGSGFNIQVLG